MQLPVLGPVLRGLCVIKQTLLSGLVRAWDPAVQEGLRISHGESPPADSLQFWASSGLDVLPLRILSAYSWECSERQGPCAPLLFPLGTLRAGHFSSAHCGFMQWPCSVSTCLKTNPSTGPLFVFEIYSEPDYFLHPPPTTTILVQTTTNSSLNSGKNPHLALSFLPLPPAAFAFKMSVGSGQAAA